MQLLRTIFILLLIFLTFRIINRYIIPLFSSQKSKHDTAQQKTNKDYIIRQDKDKKHNKKEGEYVDYEEIKD